MHVRCLLECEAFGTGQRGTHVHEITYAGACCFLLKRQHGDPAKLHLDGLGADIETTQRLEQRGRVPLPLVDLARVDNPEG